MNIYQIKKLLRSTKSENFILKDTIRFKIENIHNQHVENVLKNLRNPVLLVGIEEQPSRRPHEETYALCFELTKRKRLFVVITYKSLKKKIVIVTAFPSSKRIEKLIKKARIKRR